MSDTNIKLVEIGITFAVLAVFIALFVMVPAFAGQWSNFAYIVLILTYAVVMSVVGIKLAPHIN